MGDQRHNSDFHLSSYQMSRLITHLHSSTKYKVKRHNIQDQRSSFTRSKVIKCKVKGQNTKGKSHPLQGQGSHLQNTRSKFIIYKVKGHILQGQNVSSVTTHLESAETGNRRLYYTRSKALICTVHYNRASHITCTIAHAHHSACKLLVRCVNYNSPTYVLLINFREVHLFTNTGWSPVREPQLQ